MESPAASCSDGASAMDSAVAAQKEREGTLGQVDAFLLEVLENSRHRLTVLRMELDIQRFMQNPDQQQFEFQPLPTSYLRCCAHRVAQHYGLQTMALDNVVDGLGSRVVARKTPDSKYPSICLSEVPAKLPEKEMSEHVKIAIRPRPKLASRGDGFDLGLKRNETRTVEERKEEYDKARARIFNVSSNREIEVSLSPASVDGRSLFHSDEELLQRHVEEIEKIEKANYSRVAIFRDREKDRTDPDYDRSYERYVRGLSLPPNFNLHACNILQHPFLQHDGSIVQFGHMPRNQSPVSYNMPNPSVPYAYGCNQNTKDAVYMQWPSPPLMYSNSFDHFGHAMFQAPFYQQHLTFEHTQNC
ncbi:R3H domain-containing protein 2 [Canna indica]|uniref:R3H domain-containing protein 2 n=1 Tax=Canna indica TaxID=4628 RepID=A0AAQ3JWL0_9LILI|nr:R3H domain-containing protein 2 [Canna indica]